MTPDGGPNGLPERREIIRLGDDRRAQRPRGIPPLRRLFDQENQFAHRPVLALDEAKHTKPTGVRPIAHRRLTQGVGLATPAVVLA